MDWKLVLEASMALVSIITTVSYVSYRLAKIEVKVDTMWDFMVRRATSEAVIKNVGSVNSPFKLSEEVRSWFTADFSADLQHSYIEFWMGKEDKDLFLEVERKYGDRLMQEICIPHELFAGACVMAAMQIAKGK